MIGVTIGIGPFREMAEKAALLFTKHTGMQAVVLSEEEADRYPEFEYPHHVKFRIFDLVYDDPDVVYFDADLWFMHDWDPAKFRGSGALTVVRDLQSMQHVYKDAGYMGIPLSEYFNSGLMIMNRHVHRKFLEVAEKLAYSIVPTTFTKFKDQSALNLAAHILDLPKRFIDRRYNWLQSCGEYAMKGLPIIGAHKPRTSVGCPPKMSVGEAVAQGEEVLSKMPETSIEIHDTDFQTLAGDYLYQRASADQRGMEFRPDGTIGKGSAFLELWWIPVTTAGKKELWILGHKTKRGWDEIVTCKLMETEPGVFTGRWQHFEKMPVTIKRVTK